VGSSLHPDIEGSIDGVATHHIPTKGWSRRCSLQKSVGKPKAFLFFSSWTMGQHLWHLKETIQVKYPALLTEKVILLNDNACHNAAVTAQFQEKFLWKCQPLCLGLTFPDISTTLDQ
jgi:hypothetical protein